MLQGVRWSRFTVLSLLAAAALLRAPADAAAEGAGGDRIAAGRIGAEASSAGPASGGIAIGLMADMGVPDGFVGALAVRLHRLVRVHAGGGHNTVSPGVRAGVQVLAWTRAVAPYAALELGHYFQGRPGAWMQDLTRDAAGMDTMDADSVTIERVGYSFGNAHIGLRLGSARAAFYVQGGVSRVHATATLRQRRDAAAPLPLEVDVTSRSQARLWTASARLGMEARF